MITDSLSPGFVIGPDAPDAAREVSDLDFPLRRREPFGELRRPARRGVRAEPGAMQEGNCFTRNFRALVAGSGGTQRAMAMALGVMDSAISNYMHGRLPKRSVLARICAHFGVSPRDIQFSVLEAAQ